MKKTIRKWQKKLGIPNWKITLNRISPDQVVYRGEDYFIGVSRDFKKKEAVIHHDIDLCEESIIHELLHIRYPTKNEHWINEESTKLI